MVATSPISGPTDLPGPDPALSADEPAHPDPVTALVEAERPFVPILLDEERVRRIATRVVARSRDLAASAANHPPPDGPGGPFDLGALEGLAALVVHGTVDPLFPVEHGRALAAAIPGAELWEIEGMGHQLPPASSWDDLVERLTAQSRRASTPQ